MLRHPSWLGGDSADARYLRLAALCVVIGTVFGAGIAPRLVDRRSRASSGIGFSVTARGLTTTLHACCGTCGHSLAMAHAGALCLGPRQRACLLADAGYALRKRLAVVARDPGAGAARPEAGCTRSYDWTDGPSRCVSRLRAQAALSRASRKHGSLGACAAH